jgi:pimeloyl-ACP methyl ester carboxylesterase
VTSAVEVAVSDGRVLDVAVAGPADGIPLVLHHGTPGSALPYGPFIAAAAERGLRHVTYARPGYGGSTRRYGRSVADCAADTARVLDHLGAERFYTLGWSGGGPHAFACAALLPERVIAAGTIASIAPFDAEGLDWTAGMGEENLVEFEAIATGEEALEALLGEMAPAFLAATPEAVAEAFGDLVSEVDTAALTGDLAQYTVDGLREALREGFWGWFDDDFAMVRHWGFELDDIDVPFTIWQGAQDRMVPFAHGEWLVAHMPRARARLLPEHGHLSLAVDSFPMILDELVAPRGKETT